MEPLVEVVDENDVVIGQATVTECHAKQLIHRIAHVLCFTPEGNIVLQKRSKAMSTYPGLLTSSASGHVDSGESYAQAAARELQEELGVRAALTEIGRTKSLDPRHMVQIGVFMATVGEQLRPDPHEVEAVVPFDPLELKEAIQKEPERFAAPFIAVAKLLGVA